jgi:hypothetical protein
MIGLIVMKLKAASSSWLIAIAVSLVMVGCANVGVERQTSSVANRPESGKGLVIFYRESKFAGGGVGFVVRDIDKPPTEGNLGTGPQIGGLPNGSYFAYNAKPGKRIFSGSITSRPEAYYTWMTVESDKTYYVKAELVKWPGQPLASPSHPELTAVDPEVGSAAIKKLQPVALSR